MEFNSAFKGLSKCQFDTCL